MTGAKRGDGNSKMKLIKRYFEGWNYLGLSKGGPVFQGKKHTEWERKSESSDDLKRKKKTSEVRIW